MQCRVKRSIVSREDFVGHPERKTRQTATREQAVKRITPPKRVMSKAKRGTGALDDQCLRHRGTYAGSHGLMSQPLNNNSGRDEARSAFE